MSCCRSRPPPRVRTAKYVPAPFPSQFGASRRQKGCRHDRPYRRLPPPPQRRRPLHGARPRCRARQLFVLRQGAARHARLLRREGQPGPRGPGPPGPSRLLLRHRFGGRDRAGAGRRRRARPHLLRQHDQEGARHRPRPRPRRVALRRGLRGRGREDRSRRAGRQGVLPHPVRRFGRRMALVAQVRLRPRHGGPRAGTCPPPRPRGLRPVVPRRLAAAQPAHVGRRAGGLGRDLQGPRRARHRAPDGQPRRRLPHQVPEERPGRAPIRQGDLRGAAQAFRQPHPGNHHRAGSRHGGQCRG